MNVKLTKFIQNDDEQTTLLFENINCIWFENGITVIYQHIYGNENMDINIDDDIDRNIICELNSHDNSILDIRRVRT